MEGRGKWRRGERREILKERKDSEKEKAGGEERRKRREREATSGELLSIQWQPSAAVL